MRAFSWFIASSISWTTRNVPRETTNTCFMYWNLGELASPRIREPSLAILHSPAEPWNLHKIIDDSRAFGVVLFGSFCGVLSRWCEGNRRARRVQMKLFGHYGDSNRSHLISRSLWYLLWNMFIRAQSFFAKKYLLDYISHYNNSDSCDNLSERRWGLCTFEQVAKAW